MSEKLRALPVDFLPGDDVEVVAVERPGRVISVWHGFGGTKYEVAYFNDGTRKESFMYADELKRGQKADP